MATVISIIGVLVFLLGIASVVWSFLQTKGKPIVQTLDQLTPIDLQRLINGEQATMSRIEALEQADKLMKYFETKSSTEGQAAMQQVVTAIFASK